MMKSPVLILIAIVGLACAPCPALAKDQPTYRPFVVASDDVGEMGESAQAVEAALTAAGFTIVGSYAPLDDTQVIVVTNDALLEAAGSSPRGGYAAAQRIAVTQVDDRVEVSFVNPQYVRLAYRLKDDLDGVYDTLVETLGFDRFCGAEGKKMTAKRLGKYHYMVGMQRFDDPSELGQFSDHATAVAAVEQGLAMPDDTLEQVYRIDIPDTDQTLFGVAMSSTDPDQHIDEAKQMEVVDFEGCRKRAYFPYEVLVNGNEVEALHMRFRMAVYFPNLKMMGKHGFTKLMPYPGDIEEALEVMVNPD